MKKIILLALLFSFAINIHVSAQSKETRKAQFQSTYNSTKSLVNSQVYNFIGDVVFDGSTREKLNSDSNTIVINKSNITGKLTALQSKKNALDVNGAIENYTVTSNDDKQQVLVQFKVVTAAQTLDANIQVKPNGNAVLRVSSNNGDIITWVGFIK